MEASLMDKEVLCLLDTRQIQKYIFKSNTLQDVLGGSDSILHIQMDAIRYALAHTDPPLTDREYALSVDPDEEIPWFVSPEIQFQLIICAAGNAMCLVRTGRLCQQLIRRMSRYYLKQGYSLNLTAAVTEKTDDFGHDIFELYRKLNAVKASCEISDPAGPLSVVAREVRTGEPAIGRDGTGAYYSTASALRRKEAALRRNVVNLQHFRTSRGYDGREYLAVLHSDGNNLGITIGRMTQQIASYEAGIRIRRIIGRTIVETYGRVIDHTLEDVRACWQKMPGHAQAPFECAFYVLHRGGDDLNIICDAALAIPFLNSLYRNLQGAYLWQSEEFTAPLYVCTGIAFVTKATGFHDAFAMAEACCARAKTAAKRAPNLRNGFAGNWIDFQVCPEPRTQPLDLLRERTFVSRSGRRLLLRPYCADPEAADQPYAFQKLLERAERIRRMQLTDRQADILCQSYLVGGPEFGRWVEAMKSQGKDLVRQLGAPAYKDEAGMLSYAWMDALELSGFLPEEM